MRHSLLAIPFWFFVQLAAIHVVRYGLRRVRLRGSA